MFIDVSKPYFATLNIIAHGSISLHIFEYLNMPHCSTPWGLQCLVPIENMKVCKLSGSVQVRDLQCVLATSSLLPLQLQMRRLSSLMACVWPFFLSGGLASSKNKSNKQRAQPHILPETIWSGGITVVSITLRLLTDLIYAVAIVGHLSVKRVNDCCKAEMEKCADLCYFFWLC